MSVAGVISALLQIVLVAVGSPLLVGVMRQIRARLEGRAGAGVLQPWRDLRKLARKQPITPRGTSEVFRTAPLLMLATTIAVVAVAPFVTIAAVPAAGTDLFVVVALLTLGAAALALAGLDTGTAFGGMGASREISILALVEPTLLVAIFALSVPVGSTNLADIVTSILHNPSRAICRRALTAPATLTAIPRFARSHASRSAVTPVPSLRSLTASGGALTCEPAADGGPVFTGRGLALAYAGVQSCANLRFAGLLSGPATDDERWDAVLGGRQFHIRNYY